MPRPKEEGLFFAYLPEANYQNMTKSLKREGLKF